MQAGTVVIWTYAPGKERVATVVRWLGASANIEIAGHYYWYWVATSKLRPAHSAEAQS